MNIENLSNNQEISEQDCNNVYGGMTSVEYISPPIYHSLPSDPYKPKIPTDPTTSNQQPLHTSILGS